VSCDPERVTGFVDGELDAASAATLAAHIETCASCREQAESERVLRARLRGLPAPELPAGLDTRVRKASRVASWPARAARIALPLAAVLLVGVWLRGYAPLVAWDLARDHDKCFARHPVPAKVRTSDAGVLADWFEERGTHLPALPEEVGPFALVGARYCPLLSLSLAPHVYYASATSHVSVFVVPQRVRLDGRFAGRARGDAVRLLRIEGETIGLVGGNEAEVAAFESVLRPLVAASAPIR